MPCESMSLKKIPMAAPTPPTKGPKRTEKTAGTTTAGQNLTPNTTMPRYVKHPTTV